MTGMPLTIYEIEVLEKIEVGKYTTYVPQFERCDFLTYFLYEGNKREIKLEEQLDKNRS